MSLVKTLIIENVSDNYLRDVDTPAEKTYWSIYDHHFGHRSLFYEGDDKVILTLKPIAVEFISDICNLIGWKNVTNFFPENPSLSVCLDVLRERQLGDQLTALIAANSEINVFPLRPSPEFFALITYWRNLGLQFKTLETFTEENQLTWTELDSKNGFRRLWMKEVFNDETTVKIPSGFICETEQEAIDAGWYFKKNQTSFLIKPNTGSKGEGIQFVLHADLPDDEAASRAMIKTLLNDHHENNSVVVEEMIQVAESDIDRSPSVEFYISPSGTVTPLYACAQLFDKPGEFSGLIITPEISHDKRIEAAFAAGIKYGAALYTQGYSGFFDMDLIFGLQNQVFVVEANLRRTGGTYLHQFGESLLGTGYANHHYLLGEELLSKNGVAVDPQQLRTCMRTLLFNPETKSGLVFANPDMLRNGTFYFIIVAASSDQMMELRNEVKARFTHFFL